MIPQVITQNQDTLQNGFPTGHVSTDSSKISEIHKQKYNISIWKRDLDSNITQSSKHVLLRHPNLEFSEVVQLKNIEQVLITELGSDPDTLPLYNDIKDVVQLFCNLFQLDKAWLRIDAIDSPMCPRFHVDNLKCRLVTTYIGPGTQWLPHSSVNRTKLGHGNEGKSDEESGLFLNKEDIEQLDTGHIALLKGDAWNGNEGLGIVHRSPHAEDHYKRLYMTVDFVDLYLSIYQNFLKNQ